MTPTGSWPSTRPGLTGYSPRTMCTSVPQIVVAVIRMTASPGPGTGFGTSSMPICPLPRNTTAFIVVMIAAFSFIAGCTTFTFTSIPRLTLSVTMQKSSKRRSHRSSRGRSLSLTSGVSSTSMLLIRKRPCSFRATRATTAAVRSTGSTLALRRQKAKLAARQLPTAAASTAAAFGPVPSPSGGGSSKTIGGRFLSLGKRRHELVTAHEAKSDFVVCAFQTSLSPCFVGLRTFLVRRPGSRGGASPTLKRRLERAFDHP